MDEAKQIETPDYQAVKLTTWDEYVAMAPLTLAVKDDPIMNIEHCFCGVGGEIAELRDWVKQGVFYKKDIQTYDFKHVERIRLLEELGDWAWYQVVLITLFHQRFPGNTQDPVTHFSEMATPTIKDDHEAYGCMVKAGAAIAKAEELFVEQEVIDKKGLAYSTYYLKALIQYFGFDLFDLLSTNINKLRLGRYKKGKFDELEAMEIARDRALELQIMEC